MRPLPLLATITALFAGASAVAQTRSGQDAVTPPGGQLNAERASAEDKAAQIPADPRALAPIEQVAPNQQGRRTVQVTQPSARSLPLGAPQLVRGAPSAQAAPQLAPAGRSADAPETLTRRADGRQTAVVRVDGRDRCDPQAQGARDRACAAVIETRAAEFPGSRVPVLSPEQRLLSQDPAEMRGVRNAAERVARNVIDPKAEDVQSIAAISLPTPQPAQDPVPAPDPSVPAVNGLGAALIEAIVERAQSGTPR